MDIDIDFFNNFKYYEKKQYTNWKLIYTSKNERRKVFRGINKDDQKERIYVKKIEIFPEDYQKILKEIYFLVLLIDKDYFVQISDILFSKDEKFIYLIFKGSVKTDLGIIIDKKHDCLKDRKKIKWIIFQIVFALYCLHSSNFVHNDIKPANIVIDRGCNIEICDFGTVTLKEKGNITEYTKIYSSPELLLDGKTDEKSDMWSFGLIIVELLLIKYCYLKPENQGNNIEKNELLKYIFLKCGIDIK